MVMGRGRGRRRFDVFRWAAAPPLRPGRLTREWQGCCRGTAVRGTKGVVVCRRLLVCRPGSVADRARGGGVADARDEPLPEDLATPVGQGRLCTLDEGVEVFSAL